MKDLLIIISLNILLLAIAYPQDSNVIQIRSPQLDTIASNRIIEKFYENLSKGDIEGIKQFVLSGKSDENPEVLHVYGKAIARSSNIIGFSQLPQIANVDGIRKGFNTMTGLEVVDYRIYVVRYGYSQRATSFIEAHGLKAIDKLSTFEQTFCDLWILGSDGNWRVACDYYPAARIDAQTLGLKLTSDEKFATESRRDDKQTQELLENSIFGIPESSK